MNRLSSLFITIFLFLLSAAVAPGETIRLTTGEWPPFTSEKSDNLGIYSQIVTEAFGLAGIGVEFSFFPWKRAFLYGEKGGEWGGSMIWTRTPDREKAFYFSAPVAENCTYFFYRKNMAFNWHAHGDLKGILFGGTTGYASVERLRAIRASGVPLRIDLAGSDLQNFQKLKKGRVQVFPCDETVGLSLIRKHFSSETADSITYHPKPFFCKPLHVIFSRNNESSPRLSKQFDRGLSRLKESGRYDQLLSNFKKGKTNKH